MATRVIHLDARAQQLPPGADGSAEAARVYVWRDGSPVGVLDVAGDAERGGEDALLQLSHGTERGTEAAGDTPHADAPSATVVVPTHRRPDLLERCLRALRRQPGPFELVVVDNTDGDGPTRDVVWRSFPEAVVVTESRPGVVHARNAGLRAARGDVIAFADDDCVPGPRWVERLRRAFAEHPGAGCVTGPILPMELETPAQELMELRGGFNRGFERRVFTPDEPPEHLIQAWRYGAGASMAFRRELLQHLGGFDPALSRSEDIDIFYRVLRSGNALVFEPGAAVTHAHLRDWPALRRCMFHWGWGYLSLLDKIARTDAPPYAAAARREQVRWLRYQARERLVAALRRRPGVAMDLTLVEVAGGLLGGLTYPLARRGLLRP